MVDFPTPPTTNFFPKKTATSGASTKEVPKVDAKAKVDDKGTGRTFNYRGFDVSKEDFNVLNKNAPLTQLSERGKLIQQVQQSSLGQAPLDAAKARVFQGSEAQNLAELSQQEYKNDDVKRLLDAIMAERANLPPSEIGLQNQRDANANQSFVQAGTEIAGRVLKNAFQDTAFGAITNRIDVDLGTLERVGGSTGQGLIGISPSTIIDGWTKRKDPAQLESSLGKLGETMSAIRGAAGAGAVPVEKTLAKLDQVERDLIIMNRMIDMAAAQQPSIRTTGEYLNIKNEMSKTRLELTEARADTLASLRNEREFFDEAETARILAELEK